MTTIGYGDRGPGNDPEIMFTLASEIVGLCVFVLLLTEINNVYEESRREQVGPDFAFELMIFVSEMMDFVFKMMNFGRTIETASRIASSSSSSARYFANYNRITIELQYNADFSRNHRLKMQR